MARESSAVAIVDKFGGVSYRELEASSLKWRNRIGRGEHVELIDPSARDLAEAIVGLEGFAAIVEVGGDGDLLSGRSAFRPDGQTTWRMHSSGTTGSGSWVDHSYDALAGKGRLRSDAAFIWGLLYPAHRMSGVQVVAHVLRTRGSLVDASHLHDLRERVDFFRLHHVDAISATPTRWRQLLRVPASASLPLVQVTVGGEIADDRLLDRLRRTYESARVTHIYASTEAGSTFAVHDGRSGFPRAFLDRHELEVRDGVLYAFAPGSSACGADGFVSTGDRVSIDGDRVYFEGRDALTVNIGGVKVRPEAVEEVLRSHADVDDALVRSRPNSFSGHVLEAQVVPQVGCDVSVKQLRDLVRAKLSRVHVPAIIKISTEIEFTPAGKASRR